MNNTESFPPDNGKMMKKEAAEHVIGAIVF